ncbi:MAG: hypothetical protein M3Z29_10700 [Pseudomonadota bacterium]|nr:hypothetical protein [Pseudomonadota bacterium]
MSLVRRWFSRNGDGSLRVVGFMLLLPALLFVILWAASAASDTGRVPAALAAAAQESGVMVCADGSIDHGDSFLGRLFGDGRFRCTSWRMRAKSVDPSTGATTWPSSPRR